MSSTIAFRGMTTKMALTTKRSFWFLGKTAGQKRPVGKRESLVQSLPFACHPVLSVVFGLFAVSVLWIQSCMDQFEKPCTTMYVRRNRNNIHNNRVKI